MANPLKQHPPSPAGYGGTGVTAVVDGSDGDVVERSAYDLYGPGTVLNDADGTDPDVDGTTVCEWGLGSALRPRGRPRKRDNKDETGS